MNSAVFDLDALRKQHTADGEAWLEFLASQWLSMGIYRVAAGTNDQTTHEPHDRDEVYFAIAGQGKLTVDGKTIDVSGGNIVYVKAGIEHYFHEASQDLSLLVFFARAQDALPSD